MNIKRGGAACPNKGCNKRKIKGSTHCTTHTNATSLVNGKRKASQTNETHRSMNLPLRRAQLANGYMQQFTCRPAILRNIETCIRCAQANVIVLATGCRTIARAASNEDESKALSPFLYQLVEAILEQSKNAPTAQLQRLGLAFRENKFTIWGPSLVVAPPSLPGNKSSNAWTRGAVHRDHEAEDSAVYSFMVLLDKVTSDNGGVTFWPNSTDTKIEEKSKLRHVNQQSLPVELCTGPRGNVLVWDAMIIHRSEPNRTVKPRTTMHFFVTEEDYIMDHSETIFDGYEYKLMRII